MVIQGEEVVKAILFLASVVLGIYVLIYLLKRGFSFTGILFRKLIKIIHPITYPFYGKLSILSALIGMLFLADLIDGKNYMAGVMCILLSPVIFFAGKLFSDLFFKIQPKVKTVVSNDGKEVAISLAVKPKITFQNVSGMMPVKAKLLEFAQEHKRTGRNGGLLSGDPGNGKTMMAEALAGQMGYRYMPVNMGDFGSKWMGQTGEQLQSIFAQAKNSVPCVLFFDEADSFLTKRSNMMNDAAGLDLLKTANIFLTNINNMQGNKGVLVLIATNFKDDLDEAGTRDGRFSMKIEIGNPDKEARKGLILKFASDVTFEKGVLDRLVRRWEGFSVARIKAAAEMMYKQSKKTGKTVLNSDDAMVALREVQGSLGYSLPEDAMYIKDMRFNEDDRKKLMSLAFRMKNIDKIEELGGKLPKGVLLSGPPGTGKTAAAKALAKTSGWAFLSTSGEELVKSQKAMDKMITSARDLRPCIVFIDECDTLLQLRQNNPYGSDATNKMLAILDGVVPLHDVVFVAATNFAETLDSAAVRGGRFSETFVFRLPEQEVVLKLVNDWMTSKKGTPFSAEFTADAVSNLLYGLAPADIQDKMQQAVNAAVGRIVSRDGREEVILEDLLAIL